VQRRGLRHFIRNFERIGRRDYLHSSGQSALTGCGVADRYFRGGHNQGGCHHYYRGKRSRTGNCDRSESHGGFRANWSAPEYYRDGAK
jgi:hypothetical protein